MLNRRSLMGLLGAAAVAPNVGVKAAAKAMGIDAAIVGGAVVGSGGYAGPQPSAWYGSLDWLAYEAKDAARYELQSANPPYAHMKSWGPAFRRSVAEREAFILRLYRRKMEDDEGFREKVLGALTGGRV